MGNFALISQEKFPFVEVKNFFCLKSTKKSLSGKWLMKIYLPAIFLSDIGHTYKNVGNVTK
jgi:hypothetical protein